ncbi:MAG: thioredoxin domain-containing protein, partial [Hydrogenophilaceae bacterium]|nr:thioredoxin domain-containing protein [Hydrogenophilaceae bacterium]
NRLFVNIKVDREERPDLDQIYQTAHQMLTRRGGGWPLTMFLMPDQVPFFGGTYFPKQPRYGLPGFIQLMESVAQAYRERRSEIEGQNEAFLQALADSVPNTVASAELGLAPIGEAVAAIKANFDPVWGGYGKAPKFPRPSELEFLLRRGDAEAQEQVLYTLRKMAEGGLLDQLGGGFYRYSTDERWAIPHFEKMLYDNGPLLTLYAEAWRRTGEPLFAQAVESTVAWLGREMTAPEGGFYSALDADSEHEEGKFYVWTPAEVAALLSPEEYAVAAPHWGLTLAPNFEDHAWHLLVDQPLAEVAADIGIALAEAEAQLARAKAKLFVARERRLRPGRDDKLLTAWNALAIKGLAYAARVMQRPDWLGMAQAAADCLRERAWREGRLLASYKDGQAKHNAYLDDHAFLLDALIELLQAGYRPQDLAWAQQLADVLLARFEDAAGGFFFTSHDHEQLIVRNKPAYDNATPSGNGVAAYALNRLGHLLGEPRYLAAAERTLRLFYPAVVDQPSPYASLLLALRESLQPPRSVILRGPQPELASWRAAAQAAAGPDDLLLCLPPELTDLPAALTKPCREKVSAFVCAGVNCLPEIVQMHDMRAIFST